MWTAGFPDGRRFGNGLTIKGPVDEAVAGAIARDILAVLGKDGTCTRMIWGPDLEAKKGDS